jgi:hypothetical protein
MEFKCEKCKQIFVTRKGLNIHLNKQIPCDTTNIETVKCQHCNKVIFCPRNLNRHLKTCKVYNKQPPPPSDVVHINCFGKENMDYLKPEEWRRIVNSGFRSLERLIEEFHFNKDHPENMNIHLLSLKNQAFIFYKKDEDLWHAALTDEFILEKLFYEKMNMILDKVEEKPVSERVQGYLDKLNDNIDRGYDSEMTKAVRDKIKVFLITWNNKIKENREKEEKEMKKQEKMKKNKT